MLRGGLKGLHSLFLLGHVIFLDDSSKKGSILNGMNTVLTGIKPTGSPHLGNYFGAIRPAIELINDSDLNLYFIADYHSLTTMQKPDELKGAVLEMAATWVACGLSEKAIIYRQSRIPEIFELSWILSCFTPKGFMNRAHAYKARLAENKEAGKKDLDHGVSMGLFTYPVLMSADILMFNSNKVPVGEDQVQHVEFARDMADKFNNNYGKTLTLPESVVSKETKLIPGFDGRKMSKSYNNSIPLFLDDKKLRKLVMKIKTDSLGPDEPKSTKDSLIFDLYCLMASKDQQKQFADKYAKGIGWGYAKEELFELMKDYFKDKKEIYEDLLANPEKLTERLEGGEEVARKIAQKNLLNIKQTIGLV